MANKRKVVDAIDNALSELEYLNSKIQELEVDEDNQIDKSTLIKYVEDVKVSIAGVQNEFEDYDSEVNDIEDDLEGLVKRLSEVII